MTVYPNGQSRTLLDSHRRMLEAGSTPDVIAERGTVSARRGRDVPQDHGQLPKKPGLVFRVHTLDGGTLYRLRLNNPGRLPKYMQPKGQPNRLDVHPRQHERIKQPGRMRYVTEGEKKVDAGVSRGLLMVGLSGVWNGQKNKELIPDWDLLPLEGERYSITFDSDIACNPNVQMAADRQARLLREAGAEVFITLLPPAADGSKQGLDDFFANGGTVKELELFTSPYDLGTVQRARLTRDEKLRAAVEDLERRFWATEWKGMGGAAARDVYLKLTESARSHGRIHRDGIRVQKAHGPLALEAKVSSRTLVKCIGRLEELGLLYRDNEGRKSKQAGHFVLRADVKHKGETIPTEGNATPQLQTCGPCTLHLRAPRLRWPQPKYTPRRGLVTGTRKVRQGVKPEPRPAIKRLGKIRGAILDALDAAGGTLTLRQIAETLHRSRPRDIRRRNLPMLEAAGIVEVHGGVVSLAADWLSRLEEQRRLGKETDSYVVLAGEDGRERVVKVEGIETIARRRYEIKRDAYHSRRLRQLQENKTSKASAEAVKRSHEARDAALAEEAARAKKESRLHDLTDEQAALVRPRVREGMKQEFAIESVVARTTKRRAVMPGSEQPERKMPRMVDGIYQHGPECDCWLCGEEGVA
jgi:hypothetical protein